MVVFSSVGAHRTSALTRVAPRAVTRFYPSYQVWILKGVLYTGHRSSSSIFMLPFIFRTNIFTPTIMGSKYRWKEVGCYNVRTTLFSVLWGYPRFVRYNRLFTQDVKSSWQNVMVLFRDPANWLEQRSLSCSQKTVT